MRMNATDGRLAARVAAPPPAADRVVVLQVQSVVRDIAEAARLAEPGVASPEAAAATGREVLS
ncbi:MAG: hypothetical protein KGI75_01755 [Rhizobiaceae bacterium]|nr:hypothetical protein [Rhizobiaceae bacterium]